MPVPARHGEPSVFEHVIYVIKENRTYDQVFGDMKEGNGDPKLVHLRRGGDAEPPRAGREFTLLDNFYCSGVLSADGHPWVNEAYVTDYLEKAFGGFTRSYPYEGDDPLAFAADRLPLGQRPAARADVPQLRRDSLTHDHDAEGATWADIYADYKNGTRQGPKIEHDVERASAAAVHATRTTPAST